MEPVSLKSDIGRAVARWVTSERKQVLARSLHAARRRTLRRAAVVHYFHQFDDPYSQLAAAHLQAFGQRYQIEIRSHAVPPPGAAAAPQLEALASWSHRDADRWAMHYGLPMPRITSSPTGLGADPTALASGMILRDKLGHYQGAMFYFEGEWYWGLDRLHFLEARLAEAGLAIDAQGPAFPPPSLQLQSVGTSERAPVLEFFCSLRSPYTWLATPRVRELTRHYGATLQLKFVLPMVMRGLPVPLDKRLYILRDTKREATRLGLPFGDVADPVGPPTERGLAVLHHAIQHGCGPEFLESFLRGVFAEGIDAGTQRGLLRIAARAGLGAREVDQALHDPSWRTLAEQHRTELFASGLWGVPSFRVNGLPSLWGQDRLWMVEADLLAARAERLPGNPNAMDGGDQ